MPSVDYDTVAATYNRRYELHDYPGTRAAILASVRGFERPRVLEVGCGTGNWLRVLAAHGCEVFGLDSSVEMLRHASTATEGDLRLGSAESLPWDEASFDVVLYVNALHHLRAPEAALREAYRVLRAGGRALSIGLDPHERGDLWYIYDYFPTTLSLDCARFPSRDGRHRWFETAGFSDVHVVVAERLESSSSLEEALRDGILEPSFTSQLALLSPEDHAHGVERIRRAAHDDAAFRLRVDLRLYATRGCKTA